LSPERWRQAEILYHSALEQPTARRAVYLEDACAGDEDLRRLVVSLLEQGDVPDSPLERPAVSSGRFGPYTLGEKLGGMGEVYKAYDPRLNRSVAIKVLKSPFTDRFQREARAIAALNHPHICTLYDIGPDYLVMEHVEGKPLIGPLRLDQVLEYTRQICEALDAAHRAGIVHRDLKPANILVTKLGIKLLDFGIARMMQGEATVTGPGVLVGTPAYMAPEVLKGAPADARSDIYSLGCVIQEMVTGSRADSRTLDPPALDRVVRTCRAEDPDERWHSAREVKLALELVRQPTAAQHQRKPWLVWAGLTLIVALVSVLASRQFRQEQEPSAFPYRIQIDPPQGYQFANSLISPDATMLVFIAESEAHRQLWVRRLDAVESLPLAGTEGAFQMLVWSPDSRKVAFFQAGKIKAIEVATGQIHTICDAQGRAGGSWSQDGTLLFTNGGLIHRVAASGGPSAVVTRLHRESDEISHGGPKFLPDGQHFLFIVNYRQSRPPTVHLGSLGASDLRKPLLPVDEGGVTFVEPPTSGKEQTIGHILYKWEGALMAQPFDLTRLILRGDRVAIAGNVFFNSSSSAIVTRSPVNPAVEQLVWRDRHGRRLQTEGVPRPRTRMNLSADGSRLAQTILDPSTGEAGTAIRDLARGTLSRLPGPSPFTTPVWSGKGSEMVFAAPVWSGKGNELVFAGVVGNDARIFRLKSFTEEPEPLGIVGYPMDWSMDGRLLLITKFPPGVNLEVVALDAPRTPVPFVASATYGRFSPQLGGPPRWIAYTAYGPQGSDVYVQGFSQGKPAMGAKWKISVSGGEQPRWRSDGKELYYRSGGKIMAVQVDMDGSEFRASTPVPLFDAPSGIDFVVTADGSRFLLSEAVANQQQPPPPPVTITLNWQAKLK
jgi:eukaryotic-like serine/threonine-protein kinase